MVSNVITKAAAITLLFLSFFSISVDGARHLRKRSDLVNIPPVSESGYTVPLIGGRTCHPNGECINSLPSPAASKDLKIIAIARGLVEYSCENRKPSETPIYVSQSTSLWDAAPLIPHIANEASFHTIIPQLYEFDYTKLANSSLVCIGTITTIQEISVIDLFGIEAFAVNLQQLIEAPVQPTFNLDWAYETSTDLEWEVFRVETVSGQPPQTCAGENNQIELDYAAEYWFYHQ